MINSPGDPFGAVADANDLIPVQLDRYLVLHVGCAECYGGEDSLVATVGTAGTPDKAKELAASNPRHPMSDVHNWSWSECDDGWWAGCGSGELRIIDMQRAGTLRM